MTKEEEKKAKVSDFYKCVKKTLENQSMVFEGGFSYTSFRKKIWRKNQWQVYL